MRRVSCLAVGLTGMSMLVGGLAVQTAAAGNSGSTDWSANPRLDGAAQRLIDVIHGVGPTTPLAKGMSPGCPAEASPTGNVQVNCAGEDGTSPQNTQSETSVAVSGQKVVVGYNDSLVCCRPAVNFTAYSVSTDGGATFTDMGTLPYRNGVQPFGGPAAAKDGNGESYLARLA